MRGLGLKRPDLAVLKIGGSVITEKNGEMAARTKEIDRLAEEIQRSDTHGLIIVHGGGSFGHPSAQKYKIKEGFKDDSQKIGFSETHNVMTVLNGLLMACLIRHKVPAVSVTPSSCIITENGRISHFDDSIIKNLLKMSFTPVLYGDAVLDTQQGFTILSGDQLVTSLAIRFNAERIVIGVDVNGLYDADPKAEKTAKMLSHVTLEELEELKGKICQPTSGDVTGGMFGKVVELLPAIEHGIPITLVNATKPENICRVLQGKTVEGTLITKE
jgi:isopentenyl phosphate kinase